MTNFKRKAGLLSLAAGVLVFLAGCVATQEVNGIRVPTDAAKAGWTYKLIVQPMSSFVDLFAHNWHLGYGWGIILVTLIIRFIILPLGLRQAYKSTYMQEKLAYLKPVLEPINERMRRAREARNQQEILAAQQALMKAQKDNGVNMLSSIGCLPLLIQWPFFIALYNAAAYTPGIPAAHFYGIALGRPSLILTIIAGICYLGQTLISTLGMTEEQKKQTRMMLWLSPAMIVVFSYISPAGVTLYWVVGGLVMVLQQVIVTFIMKPRMRRQIDEEFKKNPPKLEDLPKDVTPEEAQAEGEQALLEPREENASSQRNAGKQRRK